jgi:hypothetical protein
MPDAANFRATEREQKRIADLLALIPQSGASLLDVGARDGYLATLLTDRYQRVVALDLQKPKVADPRVEVVEGDATDLAYEDGAFDTVVCAEVLEHICEDKLERACREIVRVARRAVVIGVPYKQDLRFGRTTCRGCGTVNPPWGHLNAFDERRIQAAFGDLDLVRFSYVGSTRDRTSALAVGLMQFAGNPFGTYDQEEPCIRCGRMLEPPNGRTLLQKIATRAAYCIDRVQQSVEPTRASWIHARFDKPIVAIRRPPTRTIMELTVNAGCSLPNMHARRES